MSALRDSDTDHLIQSAAAGNHQAAETLLRRHRERLRGMIAIRMDPCLSARLDPSDVVQDVMVTAHRRLDGYLRERPIAFYPWLHRIALNRLTDLYRHHVQAEKRTPRREAPLPPLLSDRSADRLTSQLVDSRSSPSRQLMRDELRHRLRAALRRLPVVQREIIVMRHLEQLPVKEIAAILEMPEGSVMSRHFRGLRTLRRLLDD